MQAAAAEEDAEANKTGVVSGVASLPLPIDGSEARLGNLPLLARLSGAQSSSTAEQIVVEANVWPVEQANELSPVGLAFTLKTAGSDLSASQLPLALTIDYSQIPLLHGGGFKDRLTLYRIRPCSRPAEIAAQAAPCQHWEALTGENNQFEQRLSVDLAAVSATTIQVAQIEDPVADQTPATSEATLPYKVFLPVATNGGEAGLQIDETSAPIYVLAAAASGQGGSYKATPLANLGDYQVSLASGSAQASYPIPLPPSAGPLVPEVRLQYDSGGVDGMNVNKNNQPGWVGIGWNYEPGYIVRRLQTCGSAQAPGDQCLTGDNYELTFNGVGSRLIKDASGLYHPQNDPRWKIELKTDAASNHPDAHKQYWLVTTPDGTKYRFGGEFDTDKSNAIQSSVFTTTVYSSTCVGTPGYIGYWLCHKAWKWNLDRVEDTRGNITAYYYSKETNYYNVRDGIFRWPYDRAGNVQRIEYGRRVGSTATPTQVIFNTEERCVGSCTWTADYLDTPNDLECGAGGSCDENAPTYWSRKRLNTIQTQVFNQGSNQWQTVTTVDLDYSFPTPPNDADGDASDKKLWLAQITQKDAANNALPPTQYDFFMLKNRRDAEGAGGAGISALIMPRLNVITTTLGGIVRFNYGQSHPCPVSTSGFVQYPYDCYPSWNSNLSGWTLWHKWKVLTQVMSDSFSLNDTQTITYSYGTPINHYDDDPVTPVAFKTWSDFRGSQTVTVIDASGAKTEHRFHRGMYGDANGSGGTTTNVITLSDGTTRTDYNWYRGREVETRRLTSGNVARSRSVSWFTYTLFAGSGRTGSYFVGASRADSTAYGTPDKTTRSDYTYDTYGNVLTEKLSGDASASVTADDRTIQRSYKYNTTDYIVNLPEWEKLWAGLTAPGAANSEKAFTEYAYDNQAYGIAPIDGNMTKVKSHWQRTPSSQWIETTSSYDAYGRPTVVTDGRGNSSTTAYHSFYGYPTSVTNDLGHVTSSVNDPGLGVVTQITDPNNKVTTVQYDGFGRLHKVWLPSEPTNGLPSMEFEYHPEARPAWVKSRTLRVLGSGTYSDGWGYTDGFGRDLQTQTPLLNGNRSVISKKYNKLGQVEYSSAAYESSGGAGSGYVAPTWVSLANYHYLQYEELGNVWRDETKSGAGVQWFAQAIYTGWQKQAYDARGNRTDYDNDGFGKLAKVTEYNVGSISYFTNYTYDLQGNLTGVTDHVGNITTMAYDLLGRKTNMTDPDMGNWQYQYDNAGNLTAQRDARNLWLHLEYDDINRMVRKRRDMAGTGALVAEYVFDALGQKGMLSASKAYNSAGTAVEVEVQSVNYDSRNRLLQQNYIVNGAGTFRMDTAYNEADQKTSATYPGGNAGQQGEVVTTQYNAIGQLSNVSGLAGIQYVSSASYDAQGQLTQIINENGNGANGLTRQFVYDASTLRLTNIKAGITSPFENLQKLSYVYDNNGNVMSLTDSTNNGQKQCFQYDWLNRLTGAFTGDAGCTAYNATGTGPYNHTYVYDAVGNITSNASNVYTYGDTAHKHAVTAAFGNSYGYDANGNQTTRTIGGVTYTFTFDYENRITAVSGGSSSATFVYDAAGQKVKGTVNGVMTVYIGGIYEYQAGATTHYYEGNALRRIGYATDNGVIYLLQDHLKSSNKLINQNGALHSQNYYYPFGGNRGGAAFSNITSKRFTGQYHEKDLPGGEGLSDYGARWYDAQIGRFLSADALVPEAEHPQAFNRYGYALNNPLRYIDPTGHYSQDQIMQHMGCSDWGCVEKQFGPRGTYMGMWGWLYILQKAVDGDIISVHSANDAVINGIFQRSRDGKIEIMHVGGALGEKPGTITSDLTYAYYASSIGRSEHIDFWAGETTYEIDGRYTLYDKDAARKDGAEGYYKSPSLNPPDPTAVALDTAGVVGAGLVLATPFCGPPCATAGAYIGGGATLAGVGYTVWGVYNNKSSEADLLVTTTTATVSVVKRSDPKIGLGMSIVQWLWDALFSANDPWE